MAWWLLVRPPQTRGLMEPGGGLVAPQRLGIRRSGTSQRRRAEAIDDIERDGLLNGEAGGTLSTPAFEYYRQLATAAGGSCCRFLRAARRLCEAKWAELAGEMV